MHNHLELHIFSLISSDCSVNITFFLESVVISLGISSSIAGRPPHGALQARDHKYEAQLCVRHLPILTPALPTLSEQSVVTFRPLKPTRPRDSNRFRLPPAVAEACVHHIASHAMYEQDVVDGNEALGMGRQVVPQCGEEVNGEIQRQN